MTRSDYEAVAKTINNRYVGELLEMTTQEVADIFEISFPNFKRAKFIVACMKGHNK
jgi:hypothetical protein